MYEKDVIVTTKYGPRCPSFVACPDAPGPVSRNHFLQWERAGHPRGVAQT